MASRSGGHRTTESLLRGSRRESVGDPEYALSKGKEPFIDDGEIRREEERRHSHSRDHSHHHSHRRKSEVGAGHTHGRSSSKIHLEDDTRPTISRNHSSRSRNVVESRARNDDGYEDDTRRRGTESNVSTRHDSDGRKIVYSSKNKPSSSDRRPSVSRSITLREHHSESSTRPPLIRSQTTSARPPRQHEPPPVSYKPSKVERATPSRHASRTDVSTSSSKKVERPSSRQHDRRSSISSTTKVDRPPSRSADRPSSSALKPSRSSSTKQTDRRPSLVSSLLGTGTRKPSSSKPSPSTIASPKSTSSPKAPTPSRSAPPQPKPKPPKTYDCLICTDTIPASKCHRHRPCNHPICHTCLRTLFQNSLKDPQQMPPACCSKENPIDPGAVASLFSNSFKRTWNKKYCEYTTKNRLYCPRKGCGEWIRPDRIRTDNSGGTHHGKRFGVCGKCQTKVCTTCNLKWHSSKDCPKDESAREFQKMAMKEGWRKCFNCQAMVELTFGCNHMQCRCGAEFCMVCGIPWGRAGGRPGGGASNCGCPLFSDDMIELDRDMHEHDPFAGLHRHREEEDERLAHRLWEQDLLADGGDGFGGILFHAVPANNNNNPAHDPAAAAAAEARRRGHRGEDEEDLIRRGIDLLTGRYTDAHNQAAEQLVEEIRVHVRQPPQPPAPPQQNRQPDRPPLRRGSVHTGPPAPPHPPARNIMDFLDQHQDGGGGAAVDGAEQEARRQRRASMLAGINRGQQGGRRVEEWRRHVAVA